MTTLRTAVEKPDGAVFQKSAPAEFDKSVIYAVKCGVSAEELKKRIDDISDIQTQRGAKT